MKFEEVLPALRKGKKITCSIIQNSGHQYIYYTDGIIFDNEGGYWHLTDKEIVEIDDWEIVKEPKRVKLRDLTKQQFIEWMKNNCRRYEHCDGCPFRFVRCSYSGGNNCWVDNKHLYSDKFLDQKIKIED